LDEAFRAQPPEALRRDSALLPFYHDGRLAEVTVAALALGGEPLQGTSL
jgi:hypothetical protein